MPEEGAGWCFAKWIIPNSLASRSLSRLSEARNSPFKATRWPRGRRSPLLGPITRPFSVWRPKCRYFAGFLSDRPKCGCLRCFTVNCLRTRRPVAFNPWPLAGPWRVREARRRLTGHTPQKRYVNCGYFGGPGHPVAFDPAPWNRSGQRSFEKTGGMRPVCRLQCVRFVACVWRGGGWLFPKKYVVTTIDKSASGNMLRCSLIHFGLCSHYVLRGQGLFSGFAGSESPYTMESERIQRDY